MWLEAESVWFNVQIWIVYSSNIYYLIIIHEARPAIFDLRHEYLTQVKRNVIVYSQIVVRLNYGTFGNLIDNKPRGITRRCGALKQINEWVLREPLYLSMMTKIFELCSHDKQKSIWLTFKRIKHKRVVAHI